MSESIRDKYDLLERRQLDGVEHTELDVATRAMKESHAPHSHYRVGSAIRTYDGGLSIGWKLEGETGDILHAEINALGRLPERSRSKGIQRVIVVGSPEDVDSDRPHIICADCRLKLLDIIRPEDNPYVIMAGTRGKIMRVKLKDILPQTVFPAGMAR
jgi:cytidine deaminase